MRGWKRVVWIFGPSFVAIAVADFCGGDFWHKLLAAVATGALVSSILDENEMWERDAWGRLDRKP